MTVMDNKSAESLVLSVAAKMSVDLVTVGVGSHGMMCLAAITLGAYASAERITVEEAFEKLKPKAAEYLARVKAKLHEP